MSRNCRPTRRPRFHTTACGAAKYEIRDSKYETNSKSDIQMTETAAIDARSGRVRRGRSLHEVQRLQRCNDAIVVRDFFVLNIRALSFGFVSYLVPRISDFERRITLPKKPKPQTDLY